MAENPHKRFDEKTRAWIEEAGNDVQIINRLIAPDVMEYIRALEWQCDDYGRRLSAAYSESSQIEDALVRLIEAVKEMRQGHGLTGGCISMLKYAEDTLKEIKSEEVS